MQVELIITISEALLFLFLFPLAAVAVTLWMYPLVGLALERAPVSAYTAILPGPYFVVLRTKHGQAG